MPISENFILTSAFPKVEFPDRFVGEYFYEKLTNLPQDVVVEIQYETGEEQTISDILSRAKLVASFLLHYGIKQEDRVALFMENVLEYTPIVLGIAFSGAIVTYMRPEMLTNTEYRNRIGLPKFVFVNGITSAQNVLKAGYTGVILVDNVPPKDIPDGINSYYRDCLQDDGTMFQISTRGWPENASSTVHLVTFTSGSTDLPKPVILSHKSVAGTIKLQEYPEYRLFTQNDERVVAALSFNVNHLGAYFFRVIALTTMQLSVLVKTHNIEDQIKAIERYKCNSIPSGPQVITALVEHPARLQRDISSLKHVLIFGKMVRKPIIDKWKNALKLKSVNIRLVFTECCGFALSSVDHPDECVGRLLPGMEAKVIDINSHKPLGPNQVGELCIRGVMRFMGYYNMPKKNEEDIDSEGFFHNGDLVFYDEKENFYYFDRLKETIKHRKGLISTTNLETNLLVHCPEIKEAAVIAVPDNNNGLHQVAHAVVVLRQTAHPNVEKQIEDIQRKIRAVNQFEFEGGISSRSKIPLNHVGKYDRLKLFEEYRSLNK